MPTKWRQLKPALQAAEVLDFKVNVSTPKGYEIDAKKEGLTGKHFEFFKDPMDAAKGADLLTTDVWTSMGFEAENRMHAQKALMEYLVVGKIGQK